MRNGISLFAALPPPLEQGEILNNVTSCLTSAAATSIKLESTL